MKIKLFILANLLLILTSCQKGPETKVLIKQIQTKLDKNFKSDLFEITSLKRRGSYTYTDNGPKLLVYFKTQMKLKSDYKFNNWNKIGQSSLISVLGSTASGIIGINPEGNKQGDIISAYGSNNYLSSGREWTETPYLKESKSAGAKKKKFVSDIEEENNLNDQKLPAIKRYLKKLQLISKDVRKHPKELIIIENELNKILIKAQITADLNKPISGIASGPDGGEYYLLGKAIENHLTKKKFKLKGYETFGSLHNIKLVASQKIKYGIAQGDLLKQNNHPNILALMALFPEVIQIITLKSSSLKNVHDLQNKRINIGPKGSGTRSNALNVLKAHNFNLSQIKTYDYGLKQSLELLKSGDVDALFFTGGYPTQAILNFSKKFPIRLLTQEEKALSLLQKAPANLKLAIPKNVYFGQTESYPTTGTTAILFTHRSNTNEEIKGFLKDLFLKQSKMSETSSKAGAFSKGNWNKGVEISIHPQAQAFFEI